MNNTNIIPMEQKGNEVQVQNFLPETVELIKNTVAPKTLTPKEFELFIYQAKRTGLDPLSRQIYCIKNKDRVSIQATIDGFRLIAERTGLYEGQTPVMWCGKDGTWKDVWLEAAPPMAAKVGIMRTGFREPVYAVARFETYAQKSFSDGKLKINYTWEKMPDLMLGKCAEALALRKAFPHELSNIYSDDEMNNFIDAEDKKPVNGKSAERTERVKQYAEIMDRATTLADLEKVIANVPADLKTDKFNAYCDNLREKLAGTMESTDVVSEENQEVKEPTLYQLYSDRIASARSQSELDEISKEIDINENVGSKDFEDLKKIIATRSKKIGASK